MPIELWWWVPPLFETGLLSLVVFAIIATLVDKMFPQSWILPAIIAFIAITPWLVCCASVVIWLITNILILIWR